MLITFSFIKTEKTRKNVAPLVRYVTAKARTKGQARNAICIHEMVRLPLELDLHPELQWRRDVGEREGKEL